MLCMHMHGRVHVRTCAACKWYGQVFVWMHIPSRSCTHVMHGQPAACAGTDLTGPHLCAASMCCTAGDIGACAALWGGTFGGGSAGCSVRRGPPVAAGSRRAVRRPHSRTQARAGGARKGVPEGWWWQGEHGLPCSSGGAKGRLVGSFPAVMGAPDHSLHMEPPTTHAGSQAPQTLPVLRPHLYTTISAHRHRLLLALQSVLMPAVLSLAKPPDCTALAALSRELMRAYTALCTMPPSGAGHCAIVERFRARGVHLQQQQLGGQAGHGVGPGAGAAAAGGGGGGPHGRVGGHGFVHAATSSQHLCEPAGAHAPPSASNSRALAAAAAAGASLYGHGGVTSCSTGMAQNQTRQIYYPPPPSSSSSSAIAMAAAMAGAQAAQVAQAAAAAAAAAAVAAVPHVSLPGQGMALQVA